MCSRTFKRTNDKIDEVEKRNYKLIAHKKIMLNKKVQCKPFIGSEVACGNLDNSMMK